MPRRGSSAQRRAVTLKVLARDYTLRLDSPWRTGAAELKRRHPELDVNVELEGSPYNDQRRKALISTQAGQGADVIQMDNIWLGEFAEGGIVQDNTARFNAWSDKGDVPPVFVRTATWKERVYGLWLNADVRLLQLEQARLPEGRTRPDPPAPDMGRAGRDGGPLHESPQ